MLYSFSLAVLSLRFTHFLGRRYRFFTINMNYEVLQNLLLGLDGERHKHKINSFRLPIFTHTIPAPKTRSRI